MNLDSQNPRALRCRSRLTGTTRPYGQPGERAIRRSVATLVTCCLAAFLSVTLASPTTNAQDSWTAPGVRQSGFHDGLLPPVPNPGHWHHQPAMAPQSVDTLYHLLPQGRAAIYDYDSPLDLSFRETLSRSWIRFDYLFWKLTSPGDTIVGANVSGVTTLTGQPATVRDLFLIPTRPQTLLLGRVPTFDDTSLKGLNGIRGSFGIPTTAGTLEADAWALQESEEVLNVNPTTAFVNGNTVDVIAAVPLTLNGVPVATQLALFSESFQANLDTNLFGTEGNWVWKPVTPNTHTQFSPLVGFRYIRLREELSISGSDIPDPINAPTDVVNRSIDGRARSNVFGPQFGFKIETDFGRLTLGAEPKFTFGINRSINSVATQQIFSATEPPAVDEDRRTRFAPTFDLSLYGRVRLTECASLFIAYDLLAVGGVYRAYDIIRYDATGNMAMPSNIGVDDRSSTIVAHGLVIGGEFRFR